MTRPALATVCAYTDESPSAFVSKNDLRAGLERLPVELNALAVKAPPAATCRSGPGYVLQLAYPDGTHAWVGGRQNCAAKGRVGTVESPVVSAILLAWSELQWPPPQKPIPSYSPVPTSNEEFCQSVNIWTFEDRTPAPNSFFQHDRDVVISAPDPPIDAVLKQLQHKFAVAEQPLTTKRSIVRQMFRRCDAAGWLPAFARPIPSSSASH